MGDNEERLSWSMLVTFPVCALVAAMALSFAWHHRDIYRHQRNYELWRIPGLYRGVLDAEAQRLALQNGANLCPRPVVRRSR